MAGCWREIKREGGPPELVKVKAHMEVGEEMAPEAKRNARGNGQADHWAKEGAV